MPPSNETKLDRAKRLLRSFLAPARRAGRKRDPRKRDSRKRPKVKVYCYEVDRSLLRFQEELLSKAPNIYAEDWFNFRLIHHLLDKGPLNTRDPARADFHFVPLFLSAFECFQQGVGELIDSLELEDAPARSLVYSSWDTIARPTPVRANPFCALTSAPGPGAPKRPLEDFYTQSCRWLDRRFCLMSHESTLDLLPQDIGLLPMVEGRPTSPAGPRPFLYSFAGSLTYPRLRSDHVRSVANRETWERLGRTGDDVFVGEMAEARARFGPAFHFSDLYRKSRFVLCPAGYARWTFRLTEAITCGAIPVILSDYYLPPFSGLLDWDSFSIRMPESGLPELDGLLRALHPERILSFQRNLEKAQALCTATGFQDALVHSLEERRVWQGKV